MRPKDCSFLGEFKGVDFFFLDTSLGFRFFPIFMTKHS
jgi:CRISPR-associated DxTHG motif protein